MSSNESHAPPNNSDDITDEMSEEEVAEWLKVKGIPKIYCTILKGIIKTNNK